ncbi:MAG: hypothetical protein C5B55_06560 [Blastocatellia bacterium]|nr:MAG: hypothetical protein C5B55_06560 [Blastocatellia bacterium]
MSFIYRALVYMALAIYGAIAALPLSLRKASGFPLASTRILRLRLSGRAAENFFVLRKGMAFPQRKQSRDGEIGKAPAIVASEEIARKATERK